jgi:putative peptide zinc metalloprotease protein
VSAITLLVFAGIFTLLPVSSLTRFEGVIWPPEEAQLVSATNGFIEAVLQPPGVSVSQGQPLIRLANVQHRGEMAVKKARMLELTARFREARVADRVKTQLVQEEISALQSEIDLLQDKIDGQLIRSPADGVFILPGASDLPGHYVHQGELLGYVVNRDKAVARVVVTQQDQDRISRRLTAVDLRLVGAPGRVLKGRLLRAVPQASNQLPSKVLSVAGGGRFTPDPEGASELATRERLFEYEIELPVAIEQAMIGSRAYVRFDHGSETLWTQFSRRARQLFLSRLHA